MPSHKFGCCSARKDVNYFDNVGVGQSQIIKSVLQSAGFKRGENVFFILKSACSQVLAKGRIKKVAVSNDCKVVYYVLTPEKALHLLQEGNVYATEEAARQSVLLAQRVKSLQET